MQERSPYRNALLRWLAVTAALLCVSCHAAPQQKVEEGATLHVYTNLLQIPVLVLNQKRQPLTPIESKKFLLRIGDGQPFHPRVRLEGEDPLTLAILIDGAPDGPKLPLLSEGLAAMAREQMHRQDRMTLYGTDGCKLRRTLGLRPTDADTVLAAAKTLEAIPPFQHHWRGEKCAAPIALWDAVAWVAQSLQGEPGRRVLLVISNGIDAGSKLDPDTARRVAISNGVAVFSIAERYKVQQGGLSNIAVSREITSALAYLSEGSGGMVMETARNDVSATLTRFPTLLRGRYIVEFSRPPGMTAGDHRLLVSDGQPHDFIRSAGTSMPVADPVAADPSVQHGAVDPAFQAETDVPEVTPGPPGPVELVPAQSVTGPPSAAPAQAEAARKPVADPLDITDEVQRTTDKP